MDTVFNDAQSAELKFWRSHINRVRATNATPLDYVHRRITDTLDIRGLIIDDFRDKTVLEIGSGAYPMSAVLPVDYATVLEPLLDKFAHLLNSEELAIWDRLDAYADRGETFTPPIIYDYCILKNVLDHTTRPRDIVDNLNARTVLVDSFVGRNENRTLHPSAFATIDEIKNLFADKYNCTFQGQNKRLMNHYFTFEAK